MSITDIENKTFAELKAERDTLIAEAAGVPIDVLAKHYIRARMDATHRDEKLGEQGKTITALQESLEAAKQVEAGSRRLLAEAKESINALTAASTQDLDNIRTLQAHLTAETERANRLRALSNISRAAVVQAAATLNDAVNQMTTEAADQGE